MKKQLLIIALLFTLSSFSQNTKKSEPFNLEKKIAIQGYDPVAYFKQKKAIKGKKELSFTHEGVIYNFSTKENKESFAKMPATYEPQYGGWCAYAMGSSGDKVDIDPETFKITDNKLYLFYNAYFNNTLKSWNNDEKQLKIKADLNWKKY
ncbi:YHS domain-containing (seleno)protein [Flavobacterium sp.]|uniref:YHS domain-containing (seleno)protein n=1 Tax=Flavobacterium sp. TaxID=239 RepID=UPI0037502A2D